MTQEDIDNNKTDTFREGDHVVMHSCGEADHYRGRIWKCKTDSFKKNNNSESVFLNGFSGSFITKYLQLVEL